ncbi:DUF2911 domain-containing protein [Maribacter ulvicola]|uniref:DUF2911 domain-containing protein n=1 Tax=Maribacter ulvicola TaxID=228959 RepID=A0A1N6SFL5_9FLAO|nr:DUF2911 domain-containing protein [Maribacter ulvicola]SIQ39819.1 Protein of unknown function [Maribacter ulvicola]
MKLLKNLIIGVLVIIALVYLVAIPYIHSEAKKISPAKTALLDLQGSKLAVAYSSPSKKGRSIFGDLVPFNKIWRTGANEPTTFTTSLPIKIIDKTLPAGKYSLWTIPNKDSWKVIFNSKIPDWGVTRIDGNKTTHENKFDYLAVEVPVRKLEEPVEHLSINFEHIEEDQKTQDFLSLAWDATKIMVPIYK